MKTARPTGIVTFLLIATLSMKHRMRKLKCNKSHSFYPLMV